MKSINKISLLRKFELSEMISRYLSNGASPMRSKFYYNIEHPAPILRKYFSQFVFIKQLKYFENNFESVRLKIEKVIL